MADLKISQLTSATLPLAGTEVLPIVQSSSTKKVATDDLTVKNVRSNATTGILQIAGPATAATRIMTVPDANFTAARTDAAQSFTGDQTLGTGNLIQGTAAKGINFTANTNAPGMTSELLNWYEEGTWTATLSDGTNNATMSASTCRYVRIGRHITVSGYVAISSRGSISGSLRLTGLPFTCANANAAYAGGAVTYASGLNITAGQAVTVLPEINTTYMALYVWASTAGTSPMQNTQWTDSGAIMFSATYSV
jgi:hypothetical protein